MDERHVDEAPLDDAANDNGGTLGPVIARKDYAYGELAISFDELMEALRAADSVVAVGIITDDGAFVERAND